MHDKTKAVVNFHQRLGAAHPKCRHSKCANLCKTKLHSVTNFFFEMDPSSQVEKIIEKEKREIEDS